MAKKYTGLNLAQTQPKDTIDFTGLGKGVLKAEEFKYKEKEAKKKEAMDFLKPEATFYPYQQSANKILSDAYEMMQKQDKIDPAEYQKIALEYNERIELGKAFGKEFASVVQGYYSDPEINADAAAKMLRDKYIVDGSIDELYRNSSTVLNGSEVYTQPGGSAALNAGVILPNRLKTIGEITTKLVTTGNYKKVPGLSGVAEADIKTTLMKAASIVDIDANGDPYIKDMNSPLAKTAMDIMLTEDKVLRLVDDALIAKGINQPTQDQRRSELADQLSTYASVTRTVEDTKRTTGYNVPTPTKTTTGPSSGGNTANWTNDILSGNTDRVNAALNYIKVGEDLNITALPDQQVRIVEKDDNDNDMVVPDNYEWINTKKREAYIKGSEIVSGVSDFGLNPNVTYLKLKLATTSNIQGLQQQMFEEDSDVYIPLNLLSDPSLANVIYESGKSIVKADYQEFPGTMPKTRYQAPPVKALGGEIDVDTKYSDFKGTETVRDLIGGFSQGGYVSTSIYDLMKKGFADGGTVPEYSAEAEEVVVKADAPDWLQYKRDFIKENPFSINQYVEERVNQPQTGRAAYQRIDEQEFRRNVREQGKRHYEAKMYDYIQKRLVENNPQSGRPRGEWLDSFSEKEQKILKQNPRFQPTYITDFKRSLQSAFETTPEQAFNNVANSPDFTLSEKRDIIMDHIENPIISKLVDASGIFAPLSMGSKAIQSTYRDDTTISDALKGIKNDATVVEDIITDLTTFIGPGTAAKFKNLLRMDRVDDAAKVISQVADKLPKEATEFVDEFVETTGKAEIRSMKGPDINNQSENLPLIGSIQMDEILEKNREFNKQFSNQTFLVDNVGGEGSELRYLDEQFYDSDKHDIGHLIYTLMDYVESNIKSISKTKTSDGKTVDKARKAIQKANQELSLLEKNANVLDKTKQQEFNTIIKNAKSHLKQISEIAEEGFKPANIKSSTEMDAIKNEVMNGLKKVIIKKEGDKYYKALSSDESIERMKKFDKEYDTNLFDIYQASKEKWDSGDMVEMIDLNTTNRYIGRIEGQSGVMPTSLPEKDFGNYLDMKDEMISSIRRRDDSAKGSDEYKKLTEKINNLSKEINKYKKIYIDTKSGTENYETLIWHELSHDITNEVINASKKLREEVSDIIRWNSDSEKLLKENLEKKIGINLPESEIRRYGWQEEMYVRSPTEFWAFLSTNLRQQLLDKGIFKSHLDTLTADKLKTALEKDVAILSRFNPLIKDKGKFIELFNKMTLTTVPLVMKYINEYGNEPNR